MNVADIQEIKVSVCEVGYCGLQPHIDIGETNLRAV